MAESQFVKGGPPKAPPLGIGVAAVVLGVISTVLFFLPVLGLPIAALGLLLAILGCVLAMTAGRASLRWSAVGVVVSGLALTIHIGIAYAPSGFEHTPPKPPNEAVPGVPYAPPPAGRSI